MKNNNKLIFIGTVFIVTAILIVFCAVISKKAVVAQKDVLSENKTDQIVLSADDRKEAVSEEKEYFYFGENRIEAYKNVPKSKYDTEKFYVDDDGRMKYEGMNVMNGVDVSEHRENIDWKAVSEDGIDFAMIRVGWRGSTEGKLYKDEKFEYNIVSAQKYGLKVGIYFFSQATDEKEAMEESEKVLEWLEPYKIDFPVAFDWELPSNDDARTIGISGKEITRFADLFCSEMKKAGYIPAVYMNKDLAYFRYDLSEISEYDYWAAEYEDNPVFYYDYSILQYSSTGTVSGINGNVDMNISFRDYSKND